MKRTWYFIDIDGCIMPNIFNNSFYSNDIEKLDSIINAYKKAKEVQLYPQFIQWFQKNVRETTNLFSFITGRQEGIFKWLTQTQLKPLLLNSMYHPNNPINYFPDNIYHIWDIYVKIKIEIIIDRLIRFQVFKYKQYEIKIYDDHDFSKELEKELNYPFEFNLITKPEDWEKL